METKAQKRISIAEDVIEQLDLGRMIARTLIYFNWGKSSKRDLSNHIGETIQLRDDVKKTSPCSLFA